MFSRSRWCSRYGSSGRSNVQNGYALLLQYFAGTIAVVLMTRLVSILVLSLIDRGFRIKPDILQRFPGLEARANRYLPLLRRFVSVFIAFVGLVALLETWGVDAIVWFRAGQIGSRLISAVVTIAIAGFAAAAVWEVCNALMDRQLASLSRDRHFARAARLRTFQPMLRTALLCVIVTVVALTALSEIGVNVAPLLAGAGIVGIAIGFGSQKLVQDVITGLFLLLENAVQVGDNVTVSGLSGSVENVSIRTIRLRAGDGSVHIVPFSAVTTIANTSRGAGNAAVAVNVAYKEDTDRAGQILKDIVAEMRHQTRIQADDAQRPPIVGRRQDRRFERDDRRPDRLHGWGPLAGTARVQPSHEDSLPGVRHRDRQCQPDPVDATACCK